MSLLISSYLEIVGYCVLAYWTFKVVKFFKQIFNESLWSKHIDFLEYGKWAIVTGGSDGIGKGIAVELAKCGLNLVILARTESKLERVADEIRNEYGVDVKIAAVDFSDNDAIYDVIKESISGLDIAVLVNNVGLALIEPTDFLCVPKHEKYSIDTLQININAMLKMTELVLPDMIQKRRGIVVNISSVVGSRGSPYLAVYGASKSYIITYTEAMAQEYKSSGVLFQCIAPAITETPMTAQRTKSGFLIPTGKIFGKYAIKAIGKSRYTNTSCPPHNVFQQILWAIPDGLYAKLVSMGVEKSVIERNENYRRQN